MEPEPTRNNNRCHETLPMNLTDPHPALQLMRKYEVAYLYGDTLERIQYLPAGIVKFARMQARVLLPIYTNAEVTICELVDPAVAPLP